MSFINSILKVFVGDKSKQDVKAIMPIVKEIKSFESQLEGLSHDELRAKTSHFKTLIAEARASFNNEIDDLKAKAIATEDIDERDAIYNQIDAIEDDIYKATEGSETIMVAE